MLIAKRQHFFHVAEKHKFSEFLSKITATVKCAAVATAFVGFRFYDEQKEEEKRTNEINNIQNVIFKGINTTF